jgi:hypothetical protein
MPLIKFPSKKEKQRLILLKEYEELYDGDHYSQFGIKDYFVDGQEKEKKLYIAVNLPALISEYYADMVVADGVFVDSDQEEVQEVLNDLYADNSLDVAFYESSINTSKSGFSVFRVRLNELEKVVIEEIPVDQYFPQVDGSIVLASYITLVSNLDQKKTKFLYKQIYKQDSPEANVMLHHELWKVDSSKQPTQKVAVTEYMSNVKTDVQDTGYPVMPVFQINNAKSSKSMFGKSDYKDPKPLFDEINNRVTQISVQLIKHMKARIAVPPGTLDQDGDIKVADTDVFEVGDGDKMPQYITNSNPLIDSGFKQLDKLILLVSSITKIPAEEMGYPGKGGAEKPEAMRIKLFSTLRKVSRKRIYMEQVIKDMMSLALKMSDLKPEKDNGKFDLRVKWTDALPIDENLLTERLSEQVTGGLKSKRKAIKELQDIYDEELNNEITLIEEENQPIIPSFNRTNKTKKEEPKNTEVTESLNASENNLQANDQ